MRISSPHNASHTSLQDACAQTEALRTALSEAAGRIAGLSLPEAAQAAENLTHLRDALLPPPAYSPALRELDAALLSVIQLLPDDLALAPAAEFAQTMKALRRTLLVDRRHTEPEPDRQALSLLLCTRQMQLLEHQALLRTTCASITGTRHLLEQSDDPVKRELFQTHLSLLEEYHSVSQAMVEHLQEEIDQLLTELRG